MIENLLFDFEASTAEFNSAKSDYYLLAETIVNEMLLGKITNNVG
jgi:hypothetical protein